MGEQRLRSGTSAEDREAACRPCARPRRRRRPGTLGVECRVARMGDQSLRPVGDDGVLRTREPGRRGNDVDKDGGVTGLEREVGAEVK